MKALPNPDQRVNAYERKITEASIAKVVRYMTQCVEGEQTGTALSNIATKYYRGLPFSNSVILHELVEAAEFEKLGFDFASARLHQMTHEQRFSVRDARMEACCEYRQPHVLAMREQYEYLSAVAAKRGHVVSPGTLLHCSIFCGMRDITLVRESDAGMRMVESEADVACRFMLDLVRQEPTWAEILLSLESSSGTTLSYLHGMHREEIQRIVAKHSSSERNGSTTTANNDVESSE